MDYTEEEITAQPEIGVIILTSRTLAATRS